MDEIFDRLGNDGNNLWGAVGEAHSDHRQQFKATEVWLNKEANTVKAETKQHQIGTLGQWIKDGSLKPQREGKALVARFVWIDILVKTKTGHKTQTKDKTQAKENPKETEEGTKRTVNMSGNNQTLLHEAFGLGLAQRYSRSCVTGVTALPAEDSRRAFAFSYAPKLAMVWSRNLNGKSFGWPSLTEGIIYAQGPASAEDGTGLQEILLMAFHGAQAPWDASLYQHAMFPAFVATVALGVHIGEGLEYIKSRLRSIEKRTGHHRFSNRHETDSKSSLSALSKEASGQASKLASSSRKAKTVEGLLRFIKNDLTGTSLSAVELGEWKSDETAKTLLVHHTHVLKDRLEYQDVDRDYTMERVQIQINALYNLISQCDTRSNTRLARITGRIALSSYRDSASMKTLAIVTMFFLPGSFISSLFSTPCFKWDNIDLSDTDTIGVPLAPQFGLYWAITIPLTGITFLFYFAWLYYQRRLIKSELNDEDDYDELDDSVEKL